MGGAFAVRGVSAEIRWAYYRAAVVGRYTVTRTGKGLSARWAVTATITESNAYNLAQRPLMFVAPHGDKGRAWHWPIEAFTLDCGRFVARLGQPVD
jgi:hypothetical protein